MVSEEAHCSLFRARLIPAGTLLMSFKLTIGRVAKLGVPAYHNEAIISIHPKDKLLIDQGYLFYYLSQIDYSQYQDTAVKGMTLNKGKIDSLEIALPPLQEQRRIAHVLSTVQIAIEQQEQLIALTRELKSALMRKLFTEGLRGEKQKETGDTVGARELGSGWSWGVLQRLGMDQLQNEITWVTGKEAQYLGLQVAKYTSDLSNGLMSCNRFSSQRMPLA